MNNWASGLPLVTVPRCDKAKSVTLVVPYYQNWDFFQFQISVWRAYPEDVHRHLRIIVVDDGSPSPAPKPYLFPTLRLFRIEQDVRWNWLAARNIGAHHAANGWLLLTDMDHVVPADTMRAVLYGQHNANLVYAFSRKEHTGGSIQPHSASFLMTRETFWRIGGYDEALSGFYGSDGDYRRRAAKVAPFQVLSDVLIRHERLGDSSTTAYLRKQPEDAAVQRIVKARGEHWHPKTLSFPYHEVTR